MAPGQVWWVVEDKMPPEAVSRESDRAEVRKMIKAAKAKEATLLETQAKTKKL